MVTVTLLHHNKASLIYLIYVLTLHGVRFSLSPKRQTSTSQIVSGVLSLMTSRLLKSSGNRNRSAVPLVPITRAVTPGSRRPSCRENKSHRRARAGGGMFGEEKGIEAWNNRRRDGARRSRDHRATRGHSNPGRFPKYGQRG